MRFIYTKAFAIFAGCLVLVCLLVVMQIKGWLGPVRQAFLQSPRPVVFLAKGVAKPVQNFFFTIYHLRKIAQDNSALKLQVADLQQKLVDYDQEKRENEALRQELGFVDATKFSLVACTVLSEHPFGLADTIVLNCGSNQGVAEGQAIISGGYLAGKIIYADNYSSTALLVTSSKFSGDAELSKTGADAIVNGSFGSGMVMDRLSQNEKLEKGWLVTTAGINSQIPKGILIGQVGDIISSPSDLFKKSTVISPVDFDNLEFVFVAKP